MNDKNLKWEIVGKLKNLRIKELKNKDVVDILLENRGLKTEIQKRKFFNPTPPEKIAVKSLSISEKELSKAIKRIKEAIKKDEEIIIYGDYDADGICATAILWECLYSLTKTVYPYIPSRFDEGYGINAESVEKLKNSKHPNLQLIITVDNGIVASNAIDIANKLGIDVIVTDHHQPGKKLPKAFSIIHTDKISGSGIAWILAREVLAKLPATSYQLQSSLELTAGSSGADQKKGDATYEQKTGNMRVRILLENFTSGKEIGMALFEKIGLKDTLDGYPIFGIRYKNEGLILTKYH